MDLRVKEAKLPEKKPLYEFPEWKTISEKVREENESKIFRRLLK